MELKASRALFLGGLRLSIGFGALGFWVLGFGVGEFGSSGLAGPPGLRARRSLDLVALRLRGRRLDFRHLGIKHGAYSLQDPQS